MVLYTGCRLVEEKLVYECLQAAGFELDSKMDQDAQECTKYINDIGFLLMAGRAEVHT